MIIDTHVHVWELNSEEFPWVPIGKILPEFPYPIEEQVNLMMAHQIDAGIIVQTSWYGFDNDYVIQCLARFPEKFKGIGMVNPLSATLETDLTYLLENGVSGIRLAPMLRSDINWQDEKLWDLLNREGLIVTLLTDLPQTLSFRKYFSKYPEIKFVIDHMAHPEKEDDPHHPLFEELLSLSEFDNIFIKVSALGVMSKMPFPHQDILSYAYRVIEKFGSDRCMWGTDHALSRSVIDISHATQQLELIVSSLSDEEAENFKSKTAARLWHMNSL